MRFAYADPPYIGQAKKHYSKEATYAGEVDHAALLDQLATFDMWALSAHTNSLRYLLPLCPDTVRIAAWVKPFAFFKRGVNPSYSWEPVLFNNARSDKNRREVEGAYPPTIRDWLSCNVWGTTKAERAECSVKGRKPEAFSLWLFKLMGCRPDDDFTDLFPGSGAVTSAWETFRREKEVA